jgi:phage tail sheath gpL-like
MGAPTAMASTVRTPGFYLLINLLAGVASAGLQTLVALLIAPKISTGTITADTEVVRCYSPEDVAEELGEGSPGHLSAVKLYEAYGSITLDVVAPTAPAGLVAEGLLTVSGTPTDTNTFQVDVAGRKTAVISWAVGESVATMQARVVSYINALGGTIPATSVAGGGAGEVDIVARGGGTWGNDVTYGVTKLTGSGGAIAASAARFAGGTTEMSIAAALATVAVTEYAAIGLVTSNTDATDATATSNAELLMLHIESKKSGLGALLQYGFVGHTGSIANVKAGAIARNGVDLTYAYWQNAQSLPGEVMAHELADALKWYTVRASYTRIGTRAPTLIGSKDPVADRLSPTETEDLLANGVTPYDFVANGTEGFVVAPITTHSLDSAGNNDRRAYYQLETWVFNAVGRDLRVSVPQEFPNASITPNLPAGQDSLPEGVVEIRDVEQFVYNRARAYVPIGWIQSTYLEEVIASGAFIVEIDTTDASQVNIFMPARAVKPLAKFSGVVHKTG